MPLVNDCTLFHILLPTSKITKYSKLPDCYLISLKAQVEEQLRGDMHCLKLQLCDQRREKSGKIDEVSIVTPLWYLIY